MLLILGNATNTAYVNDVGNAGDVAEFYISAGHVIEKEM